MFPKKRKKRKEEMLILYILIILFIGYSNAECDFPQCTSALDDICIDTTVLGSLCKECSYRGVTVNSDGLCDCVDSEMDPNDQCLRPNEILYETTQITIKKNKAICGCYADDANGYFKLSVPENLFLLGPTPQSPLTHIYGTENPPVCNDCFSELYGPKPNTITASLETQGVFACNKLGGYDPEDVFRAAPEYEYTPSRRLLNELQWYECANHGSYLSDACVCDAKWQLGPNTYKDALNETVYLCEECAPLWGPKVPWEVDMYPDELGFCRHPFTPDPVDNGVLKRMFRSWYLYK